jgi:23S rRNA (uracil747-C5)-methyltransferase
MFSCHYFQEHICRSCSLLGSDYASALRVRTEWLTDLFPTVPISEIVPSDQVGGSRIRARLAVFGTVADPQFGFLNDRKQIAAVLQCPLHHPKINDVVRACHELIREAKLEPYHADSDRGELKYIVLTYSPTHDEMMLQLVLRSREAVDRIRRCWRIQNPSFLAQIKVLSVNIQPVRSSLINGTEEISISDTDHIRVRYGDADVFYGPQSFIQTSFEMAQRLYQRSTGILSAEGAVHILDLYCGSGAFSLTAASRLQSDADVRANQSAGISDPAHSTNSENSQSRIQVIGIDQSEDAVRCAKLGAATAGLPNAHYLTARPDELLKLDNDELHGRLLNVPAAVCNPPRAGLDSSCRELLRTLRPSLILYSSCNPETLRRDLADLAEFYETERLEPFDMFPFTLHLEVLATLRLRNPQ